MQKSMGALPVVVLYMRTVLQKYIFEGGAWRGYMTMESAVQAAPMMAPPE